MFFPWSNAKVTSWVLNLAVLSRMDFFHQGTLVGVISSLVFTMWIGFGQTVARNYGTYTVPKLPTTTEGCPAEWFSNATEVTAETAAEAEE